MAKENWQEAISFWEKCLPYDNISGMARLRCLAELNRHKSIKRSLQDISWLSSLSNAERLLAESFYQISRKKWEDAIKLLSLAIPKYDKVMLMVHKPELWLSHCFREQGLYIEAHNQLENFEKHTKNDPQCRVEIAKLAMSRGDMIKAIHQIELAYPDSVNLPKSIAQMLVTALNATKNLDSSVHITTNYSNNLIINDGLANQSSDIALA
jgi:tetratricopeptide (TPR) repeat protein